MMIEITNPTCGWGRGTFQEVSDELGQRLIERGKAKLFQPAEPATSDAAPSDAVSSEPDPAPGA